MVTSLAPFVARLYPWALVAARAFLPYDQTPVCTQGSSADTCTNNIIGAVSPVAHGLFTFGIYTVIVVAVIVMVWKAPEAIIQVASGNSRVLAAYLSGIGIILLLVLIAFNSWTVLSWGSGLIQHSEPNWNNPIPFQSTPIQGTPQPPTG